MYDISRLRVDSTELRDDREQCKKKVLVVRLQELRKIKNSCQSGVEPGNCHIQPY
jgi:hypothetical protein